ncbi:hypothetical protein ATI61_12423 [Archangium gephyra]|uniref:Uncharacterized protein n=1 Tax=Archangium gephyra TaxID=48 RepID=A0AAC8Q1H1_9BACT|nr:hypothetical protein [Archangium gephyra]AKI99299.1 Hypothetical protein AA314_00926 [Archangium gephyra]REG15438.1 hypothetical protein ATI61_12423 [Archangium gephyra]
MAPNKSRFLHLERSRGEKPGPEGQVRLQDGGRFESVAGPGTEAPASVSVPEAHVERFKLQGQTPLALDEPARGQHFPRCVRCEAENGRFARECTTCGADLQSPEQLAYDAERARTREQAEAETREQMQVLQKAHQQATAEQLADKQRYLEQLNLALEEERSFVSKLQPLFTPCLAVGLLRRLPSTRARWRAGGNIVTLTVLLVTFGNKPLRQIGLYLSVLILVSLIPTSLLTAGRGGRWE